MKNEIYKSIGKSDFVVKIKPKDLSADMPNNHFLDFTENNNPKVLSYFLFLENSGLLK